MAKGKWMTDDDLDPHVEKALEKADNGYDMEYWREFLDGDSMKQCLSRGKKFLDKLGITVTDVRDIDDMLEWQVTKLPKA